MMSSSIENDVSGCLNLCVDNVRKRMLPFLHFISSFSLMQSQAAKMQCLPSFPHWTPKPFLQIGSYVQSSDVPGDYAHVLQPTEDGIEIVWAKTGLREEVIPTSSKVFRVCDPPSVRLELCGICKIPLERKKNMKTGEEFICCPSYKLNITGHPRVCTFPTRALDTVSGFVPEPDQNTADDTWTWLRSHKQLPKWAVSLLDVQFLDATKFQYQLFYCAFGRGKGSTNQQACPWSRLAVFPISVSTKSIGNAIAIIYRGELKGISEPTFDPNDHDKWDPTSHPKKVTPQLSMNQKWLEQKKKTKKLKIY